MIDSSNLARTVLVTAVVAFAMYRRVRRTIGRQPLSAGRQYARMAIFTVICLALCGGLAVRHLLQPEGVAFIASGLIVGAALGWFALRHTEYEATPQGYFYTPHLYIGIAVTALFVGRILYRLVPYLTPGAMGGAAPPAPANNPLTLGILFLTAGYYIVYCTGLLRWLRKAQTSTGAKLAPAAPDGASSNPIRGEIP
jgi:hypothetical protein